MRRQAHSILVRYCFNVNCNRCNTWLLTATDLSEYVVMLLSHHRPKEKVAEEVTTFLSEDETPGFMTWYDSFL